ncbi:MAG: hypothetical protein DRP78_07225 [Candidatus Omnitrophota bacterium]|nr:MAG: hypothetical protein DRP78_07225 [Candidatus Omnitrophota bacterium]
MARVWLIRHADTDYSFKKKYCGHNNPHLNKRGMVKAEMLGERFKQITIDAVYSSDLRRTYETADIIFKNMDIVEMRQLREINFGIFAGLTYEDNLLQHPVLFQTWLKNFAAFKIPKGESLVDLEIRVQEALNLIVESNRGKQVAMITHGGPIRVILSKALGYGLKRFWDIGQENAALNVIDYSRKKNGEVIFMNDVSHLDSLNSNLK